MQVKPCPLRRGFSLSFFFPLSIMHIFTLVLLPKDVSDIETGVSKKLEPFNECTNENGFYDRYQIGGRWTGTLSKEYDPTKDPRNIETCNLCGGTGKRKDSDYEWHGGCNGCNGTGKSLKWPTEWVKSPTDVVTVRELLALDIKTENCWRWILKPELHTQSYLTIPSKCVEHGILKLKRLMKLRTGRTWLNRY